MSGPSAQQPHCPFPDLCPLTHSYPSPLFLCVCGDGLSLILTNVYDPEIMQNDCLLTIPQPYYLYYFLLIILFRVMNTIKWSESLNNKKRLTELGLFSLKRRLRGDLISVPAYLMVESKKDKIIPSSVAQTETGNCLNVRSNCFTLRAVKQWIRIPRKIVESSSLEILKIQLDKCLNNLWAEGLD